MWWWGEFSYTHMKMEFTGGKGKPRSSEIVLLNLLLQTKSLLMVGKTFSLLGFHVMPVTKYFYIILECPNVQMSNDMAQHTIGEGWWNRRVEVITSLN